MCGCALPSGDGFETRPAMAGGPSATSPTNVQQEEASVDERRIAEPRLEARATELRSKFASRGWTVEVAAPFVVVGDGSEPRVRSLTSGTVAWAVRHLEAAYFDRHPSEIIDVWLFEGERSYRTHAKELFGHEPDTPFGYYSPSARALIMNIATGGGTLVHEIVHPYMAANFPATPAWFNEGLASLYEQCAERDGTIVGLTNWRLPGLQRAISSETVPSFRTLTSTTDEEFYERDPGVYYAQARYLCYYLQEKGVLRRYYRAFRANVERDPTGYQTLQDVLRTSDMRRFERTWANFVQQLRYA